MPRINILSPFVADLIAAGEVVERPASAVKELLENSVDAGARNVTVAIRGGGMEYIRVTDDGCGMSAEDAGVAFLRHATSKLKDERGLEAIGTLGFRGEALAAIGSVSHIELLTRERGSDMGTRLLLDGGEISDMREAACNEGTSLTVRGLFYNTPARLKFMKTDRAEGAACVQTALRCALGRPDVSVRCLRDDMEEFFTPGDGRADSAVYTLLGREIASSMLPVRSEEGPVEVTGFTCAPSAGRGSRSMQFFFCNGRYIKSQLLQAAVEQAYRSTMLTGRFPSCVIYLKLSPASVDVNVHPAKTEVKFSDEKRVFDAVHYAVLGALEQKRQPGEPANPMSEAASEPEPPEERRGPAPEPERSSGRGTTKIGWGYTPFRAAEPAAQPRGQEGFTTSYLSPGLFERGPEPEPEPEGPEPPGLFSGGPEPGSGGLGTPEAEPVRLIGEALGLYILAEWNGLLVVIDKHAAHERMIYDRLRSGAAACMSQRLLEPQPFSLGASGSDALLSELEFMNGLGFEVEPYGRQSFVLRATPEGIEPDEAVRLIDEAVERISGSKRQDSFNMRDEILKDVACKAAIKAGKRSEPEELRALAEAVCSGELRYCPHGRPVSWTLSRKELDKQFKRIV